MIRFIVFLFLTFIFTIEGVLAGTVRLRLDSNLVDDSYIVSNRSSFNGGFHPDAEVTFFSSSSRRTRTCIRFRAFPDLILQADINLIQAIRLNLNFDDPFGYIPVELSIFKNLDDWEESTITWGNRPGIDATALDSILITVEGWNSFLVTDVVKDWIVDEIPNYGFTIKMTHEQPPTQKRINLWTSDNSSYGLRPILEFDSPLFPDTLITDIPTSLDNDIRDQGSLENFTLYQNYPNPFNPQTRISFELLQAAFTQIIVYDIQGRHIKTLVNERKAAGSHNVEFNAEGLVSGAYFYRLEAGDYLETRKMLLIR